MGEFKLFAPDPAPAQVLIRSAHVLDPRGDLDEPHDVLIRDGEIADLGAPGTLSTPDGGETVEASGRHLFPAFVDPHVHLRTPGQEYKESIETGTAAAAAGGFCQVVAMPNTDPVVDDAAVLGSLVDRARREARVPVGFLASITRGLRGQELTEMADLADAGALGFTDDGKPVVSAGTLRKALQYQRLCGGVISLHEEDPELSRDGVMHEGAVSARLGLAGIPSLSESTMIARDGALAAYEHGRMHFQHLSGAESVLALEQAKAAGAPVSGEVTPHHLTLTDVACCSYDTATKVAPPLRSEADRQAVREALADGTIDCIATDHAPHATQEKQLEFDQAAFGMIGLETAVPLVLELVRAGVLSPAAFVERLSATPAALFGLPGGTLAAGSPADVTVIDPEAAWTLEPGALRSRSHNTPFGGRALRGRAVMTIVGGAIVYPEVRETP